jgi:homoserine acetyltransferase
MTATSPQNVFKSISMPVATRAVTQNASMFSQALQDLESDPLVNRGRNRRRDEPQRQRIHADTGDRF